MNLPPLTYLTVDSMNEWVGRSQVVPYVERLAERGMEVALHTFETAPPDPALERRLVRAGVRWQPHRFGAPGGRGGAARVLRGAALVAGADLVHARSDLAAASCLLARRPAWIWDMRAFWREQRLAQGTIRPGSKEDRAMCWVESAAARSSTAILTLSAAALEILAQRHGPELAAKGRVVATCTDLERFRPSALPTSPPVRFLLAGTLNRLYDVGAMTRLVQRARRRTDAQLTVLTGDAREWSGPFGAAGAMVAHALPPDMPEWIRGHHVGLSVLRLDAGSSNRAAVPTKLGEFLASGRPVVVSAGLGDMEDLLAGHRCGVVMRDTTDPALDRVVDELLELLADSGTPERARALAEAHFNLDRAIDGLVDVYREASEQ